MASIYHQPFEPCGGGNFHEKQQNQQNMPFPGSLGLEGEILYRRGLRVWFEAHFIRHKKPFPTVFWSLYKFFSFVWDFLNFLGKWWKFFTLLEERTVSLSFCSQIYFWGLTSKKRSRLPRPCCFAILYPPCCPSIAAGAAHRCCYPPLGRFVEG